MSDESDDAIMWLSHVQSGVRTGNVNAASIITTGRSACSRGKGRSTSPWRGGGEGEVYREGGEGEKEGGRGEERGREGRREERREGGKRWRERGRGREGGKERRKERGRERRREEGRCSGWFGDAFLSEIMCVAQVKGNHTLCTCIATHKGTRPRVQGPFWCTLTLQTQRAPDKLPS